MLIFKKVEEHFNDFESNFLKVNQYCTSTVSHNNHRQFSVRVHAEQFSSQLSKDALLA